MDMILSSGFCNISLDEMLATDGGKKTSYDYGYVAGKYVAITLTFLLHLAGY